MFERTGKIIPTFRGITEAAMEDHGESPDDLGFKV